MKWDAALHDKKIDLPSSEMEEESPLSEAQQHAMDAAIQNAIQRKQLVRAHV